MCINSEAFFDFEIQALWPFHGDRVGNEVLLLIIYHYVPPTWVLLHLPDRRYNLLAREFCDFLRESENNREEGRYSPTKAGRHTRTHACTHAHL